MISSFPTQRVALLLGGTSAEREVSLESGNAVALALTQRGHTVVKIDPAEEGFSNTDWSQFDIAFILLHGTYGEDGQVQQYLEQQGICYTGSRAEASRRAFDKTLAKKCFLLPENNVPTPPFLTVQLDNQNLDTDDSFSQLEYPVAIKPNCQGSSIGVSLIQSQEELPKAISLCQKYDPVCLIEKMIIGSEWTLALLDDQPFPLIQLKTTHPFYDYHSKYESTETEYLFEFDLPEEITQKITSIGVQAARAIGTRGLSRVDMMLDEQHQPWVLEVNTIPGMTSHSLVPKAAKQAGISFGELCERAMISALETC